jgi:UPF0755 protein
LLPATVSTLVTPPIKHLYITLMNSRFLIRTILYTFVLIFIVAGLKFGSAYQRAFKPNIHTPGGEIFYLYVYTGSSYGQVMDTIYKHRLVRNKKSFEWVLKKKKYSSRIHPGRYRVTDNMSNNAFINMLRSGMQEPVNLVINIARTPDDLALRLSTQIEPSRENLSALMSDESWLSQFGFNKQTILGMFIPNTYQLWWNTSEVDLFKRMYREYNKFWNSDRLEKARDIKLKPNEVITLASILINETNKEEEYRRIAGVYINRLNQGMRLQADPTIKFALGDFERTRILKKDTEVNSPYNTYLHNGLPPGPISLPSIHAIDAVLNYERHEYVFFCAKEDFSGYHNFARTIAQHNKNARSYQKALNRRNILK